MMRGKLLLPVAVLGVAPFASALYQVTSFEDGVYTPQDATSKTTSQSTLNVTDGSFSMKVNDLNGGWSMVWGGYGADVYQKWFTNKKMLIDVYFPSRTAFQQIQLVLAVNSDNGWKQANPVDSQGNPLNWKWLNSGQDFKGTLEWDYSASVNQSIAKSDWIQFFILAAVPGTGAARPLDIYVDNLRLDGAPVPEPMTLIALGGGLLAVAARRRRK